MVLILKLSFPSQMSSTSAISSRAPLKKPNPQHLRASCALWTGSWIEQQKKPGSRMHGGWNKVNWITHNQPGVVEHAAPLQLQSSGSQSFTTEFVAERGRIARKVCVDCICLSFWGDSQRMRLDRGFKGCNCCHLYTDVPWCLAMLDGNTQVCQW